MTFFLCTIRTTVEVVKHVHSKIIIKGLLKHSLITFDRQ
ncbi:Uncharacterised protein [Vibrio cholerae]|nr:Uncharacterised protein [Vibrio cholerae]